ncbi:MAG: hypothetical protein ACRBFS_27300 [Aureispira sp.]
MKPILTKTVTHLRRIIRFSLCASPYIT